MLADKYDGIVDKRVVEYLRNFDVNNFYEKLEKDYEGDSEEWALLKSRVDAATVGVRNTSGCTGVRYRAERGVWEASIRNKYVNSILYYGPSYEDAVKARKEAELKYQSK